MNSTSTICHGASSPAVLFDSSANITAVFATMSSSTAAVKVLERTRIAKRLLRFSDVLILEAARTLLTSMTCSSEAKEALLRPVLSLPTTASSDVSALSSNHSAAGGSLSARPSSWQSVSRSPSPLSARCTAEATLLSSASGWPLPSMNLPASIWRQYSARTSARKVRCTTCAIRGSTCRLLMASRTRSPLDPEPFSGSSSASGRSSSSSLFVGTLFIHCSDSLKSLSMQSTGFTEQSFCTRKRLASSLACSAPCSITELDVEAEFLRPLVMLDIWLGFTSMNASLFVDAAAASGESGGHCGGPPTSNSTSLSRSFITLLTALCFSVCDLTISSICLCRQSRMLRAVSSWWTIPRALTSMGQVVALTTSVSVAMPPV
mmetsp:Transcript_56390/g.164859  ORF Transcript_56390/g.164859 Transcript_56390/m.164859 type:complete len:377 (+) Transcript_56390:1123-2253(+)